MKNYIILLIRWKTKKQLQFICFFADEIDTDLQRKNLVLAEREKYLKGEGKSYAWDEVKQMALKKEKRHAI